MQNPSQFTCNLQKNSVPKTIHKTKKNQIKPPFKWVGGKRQLLKVLLQNVPQKFNKYHEPFLGAGALFLKLKITKCQLNDNNKELVNAWHSIKNEWEELSQILKVMSEIKINNKVFNFKKKQFNKLLKKNKLTKEEKIKKSALFMFLNRTCFNGMYRVNFQNQFNVPWNKKTKISFDFSNLKALHLFLHKNKIEITNLDYMEALKDVQKNDFVYLDPPYDNSQKNCFVQYTSEGFSQNQQIQLFELCKILTKKKVYFVLSNRNTENVFNFYKNANFIVKKIQTNWLINCDAKKRKNGRELIIQNFKKDSSFIRLKN